MSEEALVLRLRFRHGRDGSSTTHSVKVLQQTKLSRLVQTLLGSQHSEEDFDLYLTRPDAEDLKLDLAQDISSYDIGGQDELEIRQKEVFVTLNANVYTGEERKLKVNITMATVDVCRVLCGELGIENCEELSLAFPERESWQLTFQWLNSTKSLQSQGIADGDTILIRKKFFLKNEDVAEALGGNSLLLGLIYHQLKECYLDENGIPPFVDMAAVSAILHHVEQRHLILSEQGTVENVVPQKLREESSLFERTIEAYHKLNIHSLSKIEAQQKLLNLMCLPTMTTAFFPVKNANQEDTILCVDQMGVSLCTENKGQLVPLREWPLDDVKEWDGDDHSFKIKVLNDWHTVYSDVCALHIAYFLGELILLKSGQAISVPGPRLRDLEGELLDCTAVAGEARMDSPGGDSEGSGAQVTTYQLSSEQASVTIKLAGNTKNEPEVILVQFPESKKPRVTTELKTKEVRFHPDEPIKGPRSKFTKMLSYSELGYKELLEKYRLFHFVILEKDVRALLVNVRAPVSSIISKICTTYGIDSTRNYVLSLPKGLALVVEKKSKKKSGFMRGKVQGSIEPKMDGSKCLQEQYPLDAIKPYVLNLMPADPNDVDFAKPFDDSLEGLGEQWPEFEEVGIARERDFHQCWRGVVQGDYPVKQKKAIKVAALLTQIYFGDYDAGGTNQWLKYNVKHFLPPIYVDAPGVAQAVEEYHMKLSGRDKTEVKDKVIKVCRKALTFEGIYFDVHVPVSLFPLKRTKLRKFGVNHQGVFSVCPEDGKVLFVHRFSDIHDGSANDSLIHLNFGNWDTEKYYAYTDQAKEIMELIQVFLGMTKRGQIEQASWK